MDSMTVESDAYRGEPPYVDGSDTSEAAAHTMVPSAGTLRALALRFYVSRLERGATDEEAQAGIPLDANTQRPRRRELELGKYVVRTDARRKTRSGCWAHVYEVTTAGLTWAALAAPDAEVGEA